MIRHLARSSFPILPIDLKAIRFPPSTTTMFQVARLLTLLLLIVGAEAGRGTQLQTATATSIHLNIQRLQQILEIGNDPNQAIRTNVLLNMEGL